MFDPVRTQRAIHDAVTHVFKEMGAEAKPWTAHSNRYKIHSVDYLEHDAFIVIDGASHYFQFDQHPTLDEALVYLFLEGKVTLK